MNDLRKPRILVVDDNAFARQGSTLALGTLVFEIDQASSGAEALIKIQTTRYAVIILDYHMPNMNGFECTVKIREFENSKGYRTPIVCMSASQDAEMHKACIEAGLDDFLPKAEITEVCKEMIWKWANTNKAAW